MITPDTRHYRHEGEVLSDNLKKMGYNDIWLKRQLSERNERCGDVYLMTVDERLVYFLPKDRRHEKGNIIGCFLIIMLAAAFVNIHYLDKLTDNVTNSSKNPSIAEKNDWDQARKKGGGSCEAVVGQRSLHIWCSVIRRLSRPRMQYMGI